MRRGYLDRLAARAQETTEVARPLVAPLYAPRAGATNSVEAANAMRTPQLSEQEEETVATPAIQDAVQRQPLERHRDPLRQRKRITSYEADAGHETRETLRFAKPPRVETPGSPAHGVQATESRSPARGDEIDLDTRMSRAFSPCASSESVREAYTAPVSNGPDLSLLAATPVPSSAQRPSPAVTSLPTLAMPRIPHGETASTAAVHRRDVPQAAAPPSIHISIGRVEIRAVQPTPAKPAVNPAPPPSLSIGDYLKQREARR